MASWPTRGRLTELPGSFVLGRHLRKINMQKTTLVRLPSSRTTTSSRLADVDWEAVERDYRSGHTSLRELKQRHGPSPQSILRRAEKLGWQRDLTKPIRAATMAAVAHAQVGQRLDVAAGLRKAASVLDADAVTIAAVAEVGKAVIMQHRAELVEGREIGTDLLRHFRTLIVETMTPGFESTGEAAIGGNRVSLLLGLTRIYEKVITTVTKIQTAERVAHGLDETESASDQAVVFRQMSDIERSNRIDFLLDTARARRAASALGITLDEGDGALIKRSIPMLK